MTRILPKQEIDELPEALKAHWRMLMDAPFGSIRYVDSDGKALGDNFGNFDINNYKLKK